MKKITYSTRADFYYEETYSEIDHDFLKKLIKKYSINSVLDIPCGAGRNLQCLAENCELALFADIEEKMVNQVNQRIKKNNYENCKCIVADINNYQLENKVDMTIVMRQALQMFPRERIYNIIQNLVRNTSKLLVLDLYNYKKDCPIGQLPEYIMEKEKTFFFNGQKIIRTLEFDIVDDGVLLNYTYEVLGEHWVTRFMLYNLAVSYIRDLLYKTNAKKIIEYRDFFCRIRENENSVIFVIEI